MTIPRFPLGTVGIATLLAAFVLGFLGGRWSRRPLPDIETQVRRWEQQARQDRAEREVVLAQAAALRGQVDSLSRASLAWERQARASALQADRAGGLADGLRAQLARAHTADDSVPLLVAECDARRTECEALRETVGHLEHAVEDAHQATSTARTEADTLRAVVGRDVLLLRDADQVIQGLRRASRGCRLPLVGVPCPVLTAAWDATSQEPVGGVGMPLRSWLTVGVVWRP